MVTDSEPAATVVTGFLTQKDNDHSWPKPPPLAGWHTYTLKKNSISLNKAYELVFENGRTLKIGPFNWLLQVGRAGLLQEVRVDTLVGKTGITLAAGVANGSVEQVKLVQCNEVQVSSSSPYVMLELVNMRWAKIGPALVSVDFRDLHEGKVGLVDGTAIALPDVRETAAAAQPPQKRTATGTKVVSMAKEVELLSGRNLNITNAILFYDAAKDNMLPTRLGGIYHTLTSRALYIQVGSKGGKKAKALEVAWSQPFQTLTSDGTLRISYAHTLQAGDAIYVAEPGDTQATPWPVVSVEPRFYPLIRVFEPFGADRMANFYTAAPSEANVAFANQMTVALKVPVARGRIGGSRYKIPGEPGLFDSAPAPSLVGAHLGDGSSVAEEPYKGVIPILRDMRPDDLIDIPREAAHGLQRRGEEIQNMFWSESATVKIDQQSPTMRFWSEVLATAGTVQSQAGSKGQPPMRITTPEEFGSFLSEIMKARAFALRGNARNAGAYASRLAPVLFLETMAASLAQDFGAYKTVDILLLDLTEMILYAGCEVGKEHRLKTDLNLPGLLHVPTFVRHPTPNKDKDDEALVRVGNTALECFRIWARGRLKDVSKNETIPLNDLFVYYTDTAVLPYSPFWEPLRLTTEGRLDHASQMAEPFTKWLGAQAALLMQTAPAQQRVSAFSRLSTQQQGRAQ
jgi:hypothetical protein